MANKKYVGREGIQRLWEQILQMFVRKDGDKVLSDNNYTDIEKEKLAGIEAGANKYELPVASANRLGGVKIGSGIDIDENGVISASVSPSVTMRWDQITHTPTTLEGYGIEDAATKEDLEELEAEVKKLFKFKGSVATYAELEAIENPKVGDVYNVEEDGQDYAWDGEKWDSLGALIDLSAYWSKEELTELTEDDIDIITGYADSVEVLKKIISGGTEATLMSNMTVDEQLVIENDFELDLGGQTLTSTLNYNTTPLFKVDGNTLTIKGNGNVTAAKRIAEAVNGGKIVIEGGNFTAGDVAMTSVGAGSEITMENGSINAVEGGLGAFDGAAIEMNGGHIECSDNFPIFTNGSAGRGGNTIVMNGGELIGNITSNGYEAIGVYIANNDSFTMNGGTIIGNGGAGLLMRAGTVVINDGEIIARVSDNRPEGSTGWIGDNKTKMSQSAVIYHESANYPGKEGMSLTINGGTFTGVAHSLEVLSDEATPNVTVNGGNFDPAI